MAIGATLLYKFLRLTPLRQVPHLRRMVALASGVYLTWRFAAGAFRKLVRNFAGLPLSIRAGC